MMVKTEKKIRYSIVIPAYNEERNLKPLLEDIRKTLKDSDYEIILVDDASSDETPKICDELAKKDSNTYVIHRRKGVNGMGYALVEGTKMASGEYVIWVMGDRSDRLETIKEIVDKLREGYDMVIGSRYMRGGSRGELEIEKAIYGSTYTKIAKTVFAIEVDDITNAFRGFRKNLIYEVQLKSGDFAVSPEFTIKAKKKGCRIGQVPTTYFKRRQGQTNFNVLKMGVRYLSLLRLKFT